MIELTQDVSVHLGLVLTPNIDLSLKILTMNVLEIEEKLKELALENPLIKLDDGVDEKEKPVFQIDDGLKEIEESFKERFSSEESVDLIETIVPERETLHESLKKQVAFEFDLDELYREIALFIIYNLDDKGFLDVSLKEIAEEFGVDEGCVNDIRRKVMMLDPIGCGSLNSVEFLKFQAQLFTPDEEEQMCRLIDLLHSTTRLNLKKIRERLGVDQELFRELMENLSGFELYPLESYSTVDSSLYIEPDVYIRKIGDEYVAILNERNLSRVNIDEELLEEYMKDESARGFAEEKYRQARQFLFAITQRNRTLLKTVNLILKKQRRFFEEGVLMPLTRRDIADELNYNVSTITRAVSNKYVEFEGKIIPLKRFFSFGVDENISKDFIKCRIREIVEAEDKNNPLNDDAIKALLDKENIHITRRTVTKYRKELGIPNSRERRCRNI